MIGQLITQDGKPINAQKLETSAYQPKPEVIDLFARVQKDYQVAYALQHKPFREFDGRSLLQRAKLDQETFAAHVGLQYLPEHKKWRWQGRKNTARNKLISILAHVIAGMLYPMVHAKNEEDEEDKLTAKVMRLRVEDHLRKAGYEVKFLYLVLTALVNPAVICEVEYVQAMQIIKQKYRDGTIKLIEAVDQLMSGLNLNVIPIEELLIGDFYTGNLQRQPYLIRVRRISYDTAKKMYKGKYIVDGKDQFDYVQAGKTRVFIAGQEHQTLFDIEWSEADRDQVQEITAFYRDEDLEVTWVGGVFMGEQEDVYNNNPFHHRRMILIGDEWMTIPIYPFAKSGFEPIDPTGRFFYYKSGAFKEYWDDYALNTMQRLAIDMTYMEAIKPVFISGTSKVDSVVIAPGAVTGIGKDAGVTFQSTMPNLKALYDSIAQQEKDMSLSTQDNVVSGQQTPGVTATQTAIATQQAKIVLGTFGIMIADLIKQIGELVMDCVVQYDTQGELDASIPESLSLKYKTFLVSGKDKGKDITNKIIFTDRNAKLNEKQVEKRQWELYHKSGGDESDQRIYEVNPKKFARYTYSMWVDVDQIVDRSMGSTQQKKTLAMNILLDPRIQPFTDTKAVASSVIEEFAPLLTDGDPDKFKGKSNPMGVPSPMQSPNNGGQVVPSAQNLNSNVGLQ